MNKEQQKKKVIKDIQNLYEKTKVESFFNFLSQKEILSTHKKIKKTNIDFNHDKGDKFDAISCFGWCENQHSLNVSMRGSYNVVGDKIDYGHLYIATFGLSNDFKEERINNYRRNLPPICLREGGKIIECSIDNQKKYQLLWEK